MLSSLRQRSQQGNNTTAVEATTMSSQCPSSSIQLDAASQAFPQQSSPVQKLSVPSFFLFLPSWMQRWIFSVSFLSFLWPTWKTRHLVLLGSYLYRFQTTHGTLKGSPVLISPLNIHVLDDMDDDKAVPLAVRWASRRFEPSAILCLRSFACAHGRNPTTTLAPRPPTLAYGSQVSATPSKKRYDGPWVTWPMPPRFRCSGDTGMQ